MKYDANNTKQKLLNAAMAEFSAYGAAGARVDRIAEAAGCNKQLIYAYFKSKAGLFAAVYEQMVEEAMIELDFDALDLPGYAARLVALFAEKKEVVRLLMWRRLERLTPESDTVREITRVKIAAVQMAQAEGKVSKRFPATDLLAMISQLAMTGALASSEPGGSDTAERAAMEYIIEAVRLMCRD